MENLYDIIEAAVLNDSFIRFPNDVDMLLANGAIRSRGIAANGMTYTIDGIYWIDKNRNIYYHCCNMQFIEKVQFLS